MSTPGPGAESPPPSLADESERLVDALLAAGSPSGGHRAATDDPEAGDAGDRAGPCRACPVCRGAASWSAIAPTTLASLADATQLMAEGLRAAARALGAHDDGHAGSEPATERPPARGTDDEGITR